MFNDFKPAKTDYLDCGRYLVGDKRADDAENRNDPSLESISAMDSHRRLGADAACQCSQRFVTLWKLNQRKA